MKKRRVNAPTRQCHLFQPPYVITHEELNFMFDIVWQAITSATETFNFISKYEGNLMYSMVNFSLDTLNFFN